MARDWNEWFGRNIGFLFGMLIVGAGVVTAADPTWRSKPISQWTANEARRVLTNSPWAKPTAAAILPLRSEDQLREGGRMGGGASRVQIRRRDELPAVAVGGKRPAPIEVRWESALPVRVAELKAGETGAPDWEGDYYAIAIYDVPGVTPALEKSLRGVLKQTTSLRRNGQKDLKPARVEIALLGGNLARIVYLFPRSAELATGNTRVEFVSQIGQIVVTQFFETGEMQLEGKLEL